MCRRESKTTRPGAKLIWRERKKLASEYSVPCASKLERAELIRKNDLERVLRRHVLGGGLALALGAPGAGMEHLETSLAVRVYMHIKYLAAGTILSIDRIN